VRGFKVSRDPQWVEKLEDVVGLYMSTPEHALVLFCVVTRRAKCRHWIACSRGCR